MTTVDHQQLLAEIDEEVRRRRESGEIPADLERELDMVFARFAPVDALEADFGQVLTRAEQATFIDTIAPVESSRPVVPYFKRIVRKAIGWYLRYLAQQTSTFAHAIAKAVRLLGERVDALEQSSPAGLSHLALTLDAVMPDTDHWAPLVRDQLAGLTGRVLVAEVGDGRLLQQLVDAGIDAYGVDPKEQASPLEIRVDEALAHLRALPEASVDAVVLAGCVDRLPAAALVHVAEHALKAVAPGGAVIVVSTDPRAWARHRPAVAVDLSPGRPLHAETWQRLLGGGDVVQGPPEPGALQPVPKGHAVLNENLSRLNDALFGPTSYAVVARRPA
jgi:hypothetical protein